MLLSLVYLVPMNHLTNHLHFAIIPKFRWTTLLTTCTLLFVSLFPPAKKCLIGELEKEEKNVDEVFMNL